MTDNQDKKNSEKFARLQEVIAFFKYKNDSEFAKAIKTSKSYISEILKSKKAPKTMGQKLEDYLNVSRRWFEDGIEPMIIDRQDPKNNINAQLVGSFDYPMETDDRVTELGNGRYSFQVPLIPEYGYAGYISGWRDKEYLEELPKHIVIVPKRPQGEYLAVEVVGESMENWNDPELAKQSIRDGEIVTGRNIAKHHWTTRFHMHKFKDFIIVHKDGILIKRMIKHDVENGIITCHSLNPNKDMFPDFDIDLREVLQILNIIHPVR